MSNQHHNNNQQIKNGYPAPMRMGRRKLHGDDARRESRDFKGTFKRLLSILANTTC